MGQCIVVMVISRRRFKRDYIFLFSNDILHLKGRVAVYSSFSLPDTLCKP